MTTSTLKVESGIQLFARLQRKPGLDNFYPILFEEGPKPGEVIEIISNEYHHSYLLMDIITQALLPVQFGGVETGVLIFNVDGNLNFDYLIDILRKKIVSCATNSHTEKEVNDLFFTSLRNLSVMEIYDATQLYTSLHSLENILLQKTNISLIVFDTLTAFYWSEQGFQIMKMDIYLKKLLTIIQRATKDYKVTILYTRPDYFCSKKSATENLGKFFDHPTLEHVNYQIQIVLSDNESHQVNIKSTLHLQTHTFKVIEDLIKWL